MKDKKLRNELIELGIISNKDGTSPNFSDKMRGLDDDIIKLANGIRRFKNILYGEGGKIREMNKEIKKLEGELKRIKTLLNTAIRKK